MAFTPASALEIFLPELPEVETIVRGLRADVVGKRIAAVRVTLPKVALAPDGVDFCRALRGEEIVAVRRRGKFAVFELSSGRSLVVGLRMTGRLIAHARLPRRRPHTHVVVRFSDDTGLSFSDIRQFGRMRLVAHGEPWSQHLGPEPLERDFTPEHFIGMLSGRSTPVKALLLDQRRLAGVGNIYACEALWRARVRPGKPSRSVSEPAALRLHRALVEVLEEAIDSRGSSIDDYVDSRGARGAFQTALRVYGRHGEPCPRCGNKVVRTVLGGRGTWWCRGCQR